MTVKQLYEWALKCGYENSPIIIDYVCNDDWYNYYDLLTKDNITIQDDKIVLQIIA